MPLSSCLIRVCMQGKFGLRPASTTSWQRCSVGWLTLISKFSLVILVRHRNLNSVSDQKWPRPGPGRNQKWALQARERRTRTLKEGEKGGTAVVKLNENMVCLGEEGCNIFGSIPSSPQ